MITRDNYEAWFILYLDNELDAEAKAAVEAFALAHPDLGEELEMLLQTRLVPESHLSFGPLDSLLKTESAETAIPEQYQEWMLLRVDGELEAEKENELDAWLANDPAGQKEMNRLMLTRMQADTNLVCPDKESLYSSAVPRRALIISWRRIAVAASLLLAISTAAYVWNVQDRKGNTIDPIAENSVAVKNNSEKQPVASEQNKQEQPAPVNTPDAPELQNAQREELLAKNNSGRNESRKTNRNTISQQTSSIAAVSNKTNNLPDGSKTNPNLKAALETALNADMQDVYAVKLEKAENTPLTNSKQINTMPLVTPGHLQPLEPVYAANTIAATDEQGGRTKLRGFFRKVTRTFEKATNLKATNADDRLLIGGLAIQL
jgi:hypothetical protein